MIDVGQKIWHFCHTLRDEGMSYGNYIEQLTYLLFLKMAAEKDADIPRGCTWGDLVKESGEELMNKYDSILNKLSKEKGVLGDIFAGAKNLFRKPVGLKKILDMINDIDWASIPIDQLGTIYEDLLQRYAEEKKGGAGQYFTPRPLIKAMCKVMKPKMGMKIHDPATGTGGFLICAFEQILDEIGGKIDPDDEDKIKNNTFTGEEIVLETRRLCIMNLYLHGINDGIEYGDSLAEMKEAEWDMVLTNPPFGVKSGGEVPHRPDFNVETSNKQLNFVQHIMSGLKIGGRGAVVLPDNVLYDERAGATLREIWLKHFDIHTILRLPVGTFVYKPSVKANVVFFDKGKSTKNIWIYDLRTNITNINKTNPLKDEDFAEFIGLYNNRRETERFKKYSIDDIKKPLYNLDITWIKDKHFQYNVVEPSVIMAEINTLSDSVIKLLEALESGVKEEESIKLGLKKYTIKDFIISSNSGFAFSIKKMVSKGIVHLRPFNIGANGKLLLDKLYMVPDKEVDLEKYRLKKGDILFNNTNSTELVGSSVLIEKDMSFAFSNHITRVRVDESIILPEYFEMYLRNLWSSGFFGKYSKKWSGQSGFNFSKLKSREIMLPKVEEQRLIIKSMGTITKTVTIINNEQKDMKLKLNNLLHMILLKKFFGEKDK